MTTLGWEILVQWTDGTTSWHPLANLKSSNPVLVAKYAVSQSLGNKPAFRWWVRQALCKRDRFVCKVQTLTGNEHISTVSKCQSPCSRLLL
jgi:hypothetical protein